MKWKEVEKTEGHQRPLREVQVFPLLLRKWDLKKKIGNGRHLVIHHSNGCTGLLVIGLLFQTSHSHTSTCSCSTEGPTVLTSLFALV